MATILIADADPALLDTLRTAAEALGHTVATATDGAQAREFLNHTKLDCVFLDVELPKASGVRLLRMMRRHQHHFRHTGTALMCGSSARAQWLLEQARETPPEAVLSKPFSIKDLEDAINAMAATGAKGAFRLGRRRRLSLLETTKF